MVYALNAQSVALTGRGLTGEWNPLSLTPMHQDFAELPSVIMAPFFSLPISTSLAVKLPFILMSLTLPGILGWLAKKISNDTFIGVATGLLAAANPWIWQFGRLSFDPTFSLFFLLIGTAFLVSLHHWKKLISIPFFFLAFYQYQGHKLVFLPWILLWCFFLWLQDKKHRKQPFPLLIVGIFAAMLFSFYIFIQLPGQQSAKRLTSILTPKHSVIIQQVNDQRRLSLQSPLTKIAINSWTVWGFTIIERYINVYNPRLLFWEGQANNSAFSVWNHGFFYLTDIVLLCAGAFALTRAQHRYWRNTFLLLLLIAPLPAVLAETQWYVFRASLIVPLLLLLAGFGAKELQKRLPHHVFLIFIALYIAGIARFTYLYFTQYPILSAERHYFTDKVLSSYLSRLPDQKPIHIYTPEAEFPFKAYVFYNQLLSSETASSIQQAFKTQRHTFNGKSFTQNCLDINTVLTSSDTFVVRSDVGFCGEQGSIPWDQVPATQAARLRDHLTLAAIKDSGEVYAIFHDTLCSDTELGTYLRIFSLDQLAPEHLDSQQFCRTWVTDLRPLTAPEK